MAQDKEKQKQLLVEVMNEDAKDGLYNQMTAVEWLKKELEVYGDPLMLHIDWKTLDELYEQAKQLEADRLKSAFIAGYAEGYIDGECLHVKDADSAAHEWEYLNNK